MRRVFCVLGLFSVLTLAPALGVGLFSAALAQPAIDREAPSLPTRDPYADCVCRDGQAGDVRIVGIVRDAELRLGPDGRSVLPEQITVFSVLEANADDIGDMARIAHLTNPADCGVSFEYGRRYTVIANRIDDRLETNWCLDPRRPVDD